MVYAILAGAMVVVMAFGFHYRCALGWHPQDELRMRSGERLKGGRVIATWWCMACGRDVNTTETRQHRKTLQAIGSQRKHALEQSKVIRFHVVEKKKKKGAA